MQSTRALPQTTIAAMPVQDFFADVIRCSRDAFMRDHWNRASRISSLADVDALIEGFCGADVQLLVAECRKSCNGTYSAEEQDEMLRDLDSHRRTLK